MSGLCGILLGCWSHQMVSNIREGFITTNKTPHPSGGSYDHTMVTLLLSWIHHSVRPYGNTKEKKLSDSTNVYPTPQKIIPKHTFRGLRGSCPLKHQQKKQLGCFLLFLRTLSSEMYSKNKKTPTQKKGGPWTSQNPTHTFPCESPQPLHLHGTLGKVFRNQQW